MRIAVSGSSGYIGKSLIKHLSVFHNIVVIKRYVLNDKEKLFSEIKDCDGIIVLNGKSIISRWTKKNVKEIYDSRINTISKIVTVINDYKVDLKFLITASAIGNSSDFEYNSDSLSSYSKSSFLNKLINDWENFVLNNKSIKIVSLRFGIVVGEKAQFVLKHKLLWFTKNGVTFGKKSLKINFIHIDDICGIVDHIIKYEMEGRFNCVSPQIITSDLLQSINALFVINVPKFVTKLLFGKAGFMLINSTLAYPKGLLESGYKFKYTSINKALSNSY